MPQNGMVLKGGGPSPFLASLVFINVFAVDAGGGR